MAKSKDIGFYEKNLLSQRLVVVATVADTIHLILRGQPKYLSKFFDVHIITSHSSLCEQIRTSENVPVHTVDMKRRIAPFHDLVSIIAMYKLIKQLKPDVIHSYTPKAGLVAMLAGKISGVKVRVHTFTGLLFPTKSGPMRWLLICIDRLIAHCATQVVPEGNGVRADLLGVGISRNCSPVILNGNIAGVDTDHYSPRNYFTGNDDFTFVYLGRLNRDKGVRELAQAFAQLPPRAKLVIVGEIDSSNPTDEKTLQVLRADDRVSCVGFQQDIRPWLERAQILVLPSYREGFPNSVLQANSMGVPAIVTDVNGSNEIVVHGLTGWIVAPRDSNALCHAMFEAMNLDAVNLQQMRRRCRERIVTRFERKEYLGKLIEFYKTQLRIG